MNEMAVHDTVIFNKKSWLIASFNTEAAFVLFVFFLLKKGHTNVDALTQYDL